MTGKIFLLPQSVYQEKWAKVHDLHPVYFRGWEVLEVLFACGIGILLLPLASLNTWLEPTGIASEWVSHCGLLHCGRQLLRRN